VYRAQKQKLWSMKRRNINRWQSPERDDESPENKEVGGVGMEAMEKRGGDR